MEWNGDSMGTTSTDQLSLKPDICLHIVMTYQISHPMYEVFLIMTPSCISESHRHPAHSSSTDKRPN